MSARFQRNWSRHFKLMMRHTWLISLAAILLFAGLGAVAFYIATLPSYLKIAVGPPNSEDVRVVQALTAQLARDRASVRLRPMVKGEGTRETATAIDTGEADLAVVRRDIAMPREGRVVAIWRKNVAVIIVPVQEEPKAAPKLPGRAAAKAAARKAAAAKAKLEKEKIEKVEDLVGKRLGVIGRSQSNIDLLKVIVRQYNISPDKIVVLSGAEAEKAPAAPDKITVVQFDPNNVAVSIRESKVDAILSVGPVSSPITADAISAATRDKEPPSFLAITAAEAIAERNPVYEATEIKAGAFGGSPPRPEESVDTIGINHYLVARRKLSEDVVADFTKHLFLVRAVLAAEVPSTAKIEAPDTDKDAAVPVHPGAAAYIDGELKTFFDRYNDLLYYGLMIFSFFGSALAGIASYTKSDDRIRRMKALDHLLDVIKSARTADSPAELDALQEQADKIHGAMIREVENNTLDEPALMAFQISLEQARGAINDRRTFLASNPARAHLAKVETGFALERAQGS